MFTVTLERKWSGFGMARTIKIWNNEKHISNINLEEVKDINLEGEINYLQVSMDWCKSKKIEIREQDHKNGYLVIKTAPFSLAVFFTFFYPSKVFFIEYQKNKT